jgi:hypothetical protein
MFSMLRKLILAIGNLVAPRFAEPTLSTYGGLLRDPGYAGMLVDQNPYLAISLTNDQSVAIQFGTAVARSAADNTCKAPTVDTDPIIGIALRHAIMPTLGPASGGTNLVQYNQNMAVPVLRDGLVYAVPAENVSRGDAVVSLTASNGTLGSAANSGADATAAAAGNGKATGTITFGAQPAAGDTVTVNGVVFTFIATAAGAYPTVNGVVTYIPNCVIIGASANATAAALQLALAESINPALIGAEYTVATDVVTITVQVGGTAGNAFTLATSDSTNITLSGATLASGAANTGNATIALGGQETQWDAIPGVYRIVCTAATTANVFKPTGDLLGTLTFGTPFNDEIVVTITAGGTACVAGDSFTVTFGAGRVPVPGATWEQTGGASGVALAIRIRN